MALAFGYGPLPIKKLGWTRRRGTYREERGEFEAMGMVKICKRSHMLGHGVLYPLVQGTLGVLIVC